MKKEVSRWENSIENSDQIVRENRSSPKKTTGGGVGGQAGAASNSIWQTNELNKQKQGKANLERKRDSLKNELNKINND